MRMPNNFNRSFGTFLAMLFRQCRQAARCERRCMKTRVSGCESLFSIRAEAWRLNRSNIFLSPFLQLQEEPGWVFQSFIKSFAIMVVQSTCAVARDTERQ